MPLSQFQILQKIGQGAYSTVHKVKRISDGKIYALKQVKINSLKQKEKENALNEVRLLASISCQYIIKYKQSFFDQKSSTLCMIIEYAENGDLQKLIMKNKDSLKFIPETQIWKMAKHVLSALNVLHQKNIIHRDLKSANIFITKNTYKIADLNVSKLLKHSLAYTQTGTPYYASPEVWQDKPYELKSDIWSLGCILYEAAALKPPFTATSMDGLYKKVMKGVYPRLPSNYSQRLQSFISKCLQNSPSKRPTSKQLLNMLPENIENLQSEENEHHHSQINLLETIKVPRNLNSWRNDLPKSNYQNQTSQKHRTIVSQNNIGSQPNLRLGQVSQHRLRQIVKAKEQQRMIEKKQSLRKLNPQHGPLSSYESVRSKIHTEHQIYENPSLMVRNDHNSQQDQIGLPRINKIYSDALNQISSDQKLYENHNRVQEILNRMKDAEKRKYQHNRPTWWG